MAPSLVEFSDLLHSSTLRRVPADVLELELRQIRQEAAAGPGLSLSPVGHEMARPPRVPEPMLAEGTTR
jgi:hypothetical protein